VSTTSTAPDAGTAADVVVRLRDIGKTFPGVIANQDVNIDVHKGTVHAIVGENGAGKSTLMKILYGVQKPDSGTIEIDGEQVSFSSPSDAIAHGVGMVFQHFMLADNLTVLENVVLGAEKLHGIGDAARARIRELSDTYGLGIEPDALVANLGVGARQRIEILKVLYRGARIVILDEPTAVLVPQEVDELFDNLRELKSEGLAVIFISHKLDEVLSVADTVTVIRRGTTVQTLPGRSVTSRQLAELMVGSELPSPSTEASTVTDREILEVVDLGLPDPAGGRPLLGGISFRIHAGEILGIAGVEGNGQSELVGAILGLTPATGSITLDGVDITHLSTMDRREAGIGLIAEDRQRDGMVLSMPLWENAILGHQSAPEFTQRGMLNRRAARERATQAVREFDVRTPSIDVKAFTLSGGNQQKLIVGREMLAEPKVLVAAHPTRGVDVGAQALIWDVLRDARANGMAMLLVSADLEELIGLSDRLLVMLRGRIVAELDPATVTPSDLGTYMTGANQQPANGRLEAER